MKFFLCLAYTQVLQKKEKERGEGGGGGERAYTQVLCPCHYLLFLVVGLR